MPSLLDEPTPSWLDGEKRLTKMVSLFCFPEICPSSCYQRALTDEIWLSFMKILTEEDGNDSVELICPVQNGNLPVEFDDYFNVCHLLKFNLNQAVRLKNQR